MLSTVHWDAFVAAALLAIIACGWDVLIKLKWCCKIYFISHKEQYRQLGVKVRASSIYACRAYKLSKQITRHENWNCVCGWADGGGRGSLAA